MPSKKPKNMSQPNSGGSAGGDMGEDFMDQIYEDVDCSGNSNHMSGMSGGAGEEGVDIAQEGPDEEEWAGGVGYPASRGSKKNRPSTVRVDLSAWKEHEMSGFYFDLDLGEEAEAGDGAVREWERQLASMEKARSAHERRSKEAAEQRKLWKSRLAAGWDEASVDEASRDIGLFLEIFANGGGMGSSVGYKAQQADRAGLFELVRRSARLGVPIATKKVGKGRATMLSACWEHSLPELCQKLVSEGLVGWEAWPEGAKAFGGLKIEEAAKSLLAEAAMLEWKSGDSSAFQGLNKAIFFPPKLAAISLFCSASEATRARVSAAMGSKLGELADRAWEMAPAWEMMAGAGKTHKDGVQEVLSCAMPAKASLDAAESLDVAIQAELRKVAGAKAWCAACQCAIEADCGSLLETLLGKPEMLGKQMREGDPEQAARLGPEGMMSRALKADARECVEALAGRGEWGVNLASAALRPAPAIAALAAAATDGSDDRRAAWGRRLLPAALRAFGGAAIEGGHAPEMVAKWLDGILASAIASKKGNALGKAQACVLDLMLDMQIWMGMAQKPMENAPKRGMRL